MKKTQVERVLSNLSAPGVILSYNTQEGFPIEAKVTAYSCNDCTTEIIANRLNQPFCPGCAGDLKQSNNKVISFDKKDYKKLNPLAVCSACDTSYVANAATVAAMDGVKFHCPTCTTLIKASEDADESGETENDDDVTDVSEDSNDSEDTSGDNTSEEDSDESTDDGTDPELDEVMNNLSPDNTSTDETPTEGDTTSTDTPTVETPVETPTETPTVETTPVATAEDTSAEDSETTKSEEDEDETEDSDAVQASYFRAALKKTKQFDLVASSDYRHWYLMGDRTPLAISAFEDASPEVKPIFNNDSYKNAFESSKEADGGVNEQLLNDFGFTPVGVNVDLDDVQKQAINDAVDEQTAELKNKIEEVAALYDQCIGIAAMGDLKGITPNPGSLRAPLIASLKAINVRNPDALIDGILAKHMPDYIKGLIAKANELTVKSEAGLKEISEMITSAEYRTPVTASTDDVATKNVVPFSVVADTNQKNGNLDSKDRVEASSTGSNLTVDKMRSALSGIRGINRR